MFVFQTFLEIYGHCTVIGGMAVQKNITWQDIDSYCRLRKLDLTQLELSYLIRINEIAESEISELEKDK